MDQANNRNNSQSFSQSPKTPNNSANSSELFSTPKKKFSLDKFLSKLFFKNNMEQQNQESPNLSNNNIKTTGYNSPPLNSSNQSNDKRFNLLFRSNSQNESIASQIIELTPKESNSKYKIYLFLLLNLKIGYNNFKNKGIIIIID